MKRFFRDTGILLAFCGAFYLLTVLVSRIEGESTTDATDFSPVRKRANVLFYDKDWPAAQIEFKKLTEQDPFNGYAWDGYSRCLWEVRRAAIVDLVKLAGTNPPSSENIELDPKIAGLTEQTTEVLLNVKKFARYRSSALLRLAALECDRGNYDEAMDFLEEFVGRGYRTQRGLEWIENYGKGGSSQVVLTFPSFRLDRSISLVSFPSDAESRLHQDPRFWELVRRERHSPNRY